MIAITMMLWEGSVKKKWKSLMTFAIKHRTPPPLNPLMTVFPFSKHTKKGLKQCFWTKKHLFLWSKNACWYARPPPPPLAKVMNNFHFLDALASLDLKLSVSQ